MGYAPSGPAPTLATGTDTGANHTVTAATERLLRIMDRLRDPAGGCAWDLEQTFRTIAPHTVEEAYEVAEAIEQDDLPALKGELGDLLFQVVFHARMAKEAGAFDYDDVATAICDKMVARHPHVFGDATVADAAAQTRAWEDRKARERQEAARKAGRPDSALDGVSTALPSVTRALKLQARAARVGFDWPDAARVLDKLREETDEMAAELGGAAPPVMDRVTDEVADLLFTCVNLARKLGVDPEQALRHGNAKFERRFRQMETLLAADGRRPEDTPLDDMEACWQRAKQELSRR